MSPENAFTKDNLEVCLKALGKEYRRLGGTKMPAEIVLVGGASVLANYGFRDATYDMDAIISASSAMKEAINKVGDELGLPNGWLNTDFTKTKSFSTKLSEVSSFYRTYSNVLAVRTVTSEYLVAMKLMSGRKYKNDISDIVGILYEHQQKGVPITEKAVDHAVRKLYGSWDAVPSDSRAFIKEILKAPDFTALYQEYKANEAQSKEILLEFDKTHPKELGEGNINEILEQARRRQESNGESR